MNDVGAGNEAMHIRHPLVIKLCVYLLISSSSLVPLLNWLKGAVPRVTYYSASKYAE